MLATAATESKLTGYKAKGFWGLVLVLYFFFLLSGSRVYLHGSSKLQMTPPLQNLVKLLLCSRLITDLRTKFQLAVSFGTSGGPTNPAAPLQLFSQNTSESADSLLLMPVSVS